MGAGCDRAVKGEAKETEEGVLKVIVSNSVYFTKTITHPLLQRLLQQCFWYSAIEL